MNTSNRIQISAPFERLFALAADIARWPEILPHYRWVKILERRPAAPHPTLSPPRGERASEATGEGSAVEVVAEMAARHKGVPLWWRTIQRPLRDEKRIEFTHIAGITKGMEVQWTFEEAGETCLGPNWLVQIRHQFQPSWPRPGPWFADRIVGEIFVKQVANKTLTRIKDIVETP